jgi:hypothetical protein
MMDIIAIYMLDAVSEMVAELVEVSPYGHGRPVCCAPVNDAVDELVPRLSPWSWNKWH